MSSNIYTTGLRNDGSYKVSGQPYVVRKTINVGQEVKVEFPYVTKNVTVRIPKPPNAAAYFQSVGSGRQFWLSGERGINSIPSLPLFGDDNAGTVNDFTISWWVKLPDSLKNERHFVLSKYDPSYANTGFSQTQNSPPPFLHTRFTISPANGGGVIVLQADHPAIESNWVHFVLTQHDGNTTIYANGANEATTANNLMMSRDIRLGHNGSNMVEKLNLDEFTFWQDGFTDVEVAELYNSREYFNPNFHSKATSLHSWWTMGDHPDDTKIDIDTQLPYQNGTTLDVAMNSVSGGVNLNLHRYNLDEIFKQMSGPWTTQTTGKIRVHTLSTGSASGANIVANNHYKELQGYGESYTFPMKGREIYISGLGAQTTVEIIAELTNIPTGSMYALTGSGIDE